MASKDRKRQKSAASERGSSVRSQDSLFMGLETMELADQHEDSASGTFKKPRRKEIPTGTNASKKLDYNEQSYLPKASLIVLNIDDHKVSQPVSQLCGNYIFNLAAMVLSMSEVALCIKCKKGVIELFEVECPDTCASKLIFRCKNCHNYKVFMNVGEINSTSRNSLDSACVLGGRIAGLRADKLRSYHASLNIPPPPNPYRFPKIQADVLAAAEKEAKATMDRATMELQFQMSIDPATQCTYVSASIDAAYPSSNCLSSTISTETGKVLANKIACKKCLICKRYQNRKQNGALSELDVQKCGDHKETCTAEYSDYAAIHLETAVAPEVIKQTHERGIVFHTLVYDGDSYAVDALNNKNIYKNLGINLTI